MSEQKYNTVLTPIDEKGSFYRNYKDNSMGRILHYIYVICGLRYAERVRFNGDNGGIIFQDQPFAIVKLDKGFPFFIFNNEVFNKKQKQLLEEK